MKISYMKKMFPDYEEEIVNDAEMRSIFDVLKTADEDGFDNVNIIVGADRQSEFENLAQKYNGELYDFDLIRVISAGVRDSDAEGVEGMSASKMRKAVVDGDFKSFKTGTPKSIKDADLLPEVRANAKFTTSALIPFSYKISAASRDFPTIIENAIIVTSEPSFSTLAFPIGNKKSSLSGQLKDWPYITSFSRKITGSGSLIADFNNPLASLLDHGETTFKPGQ